MFNALRREYRSYLYAVAALISLLGFAFAVFVGAWLFVALFLIMGACMALLLIAGDRWYPVALGVLGVSMLALGGARLAIAGYAGSLTLVLVGGGLVVLARGYQYRGVLDR